MTWDFAEGNSLSDGTASWADAFEPPAKVIESIVRSTSSAGHVAQADAAQHPLPNDFAAAVISDPPYYDAVPDL